MSHCLLVECVPNLSEGRETARIDAVADAITEAPGVLLLHRTSDADHHRSVFTVAASPLLIVDAAVRAVRKAAELINLNSHRGVHPRLGALDVLPFVPLDGCTMNECIDLARQAGKRIWEELGIPVYFYEQAATRPDRVKLEDVRRGGFEGLREAVKVDVEKRPDVGGPGLHPTAGAVIVGARKMLIAYNINLRSNDLNLAQGIARRIRASSGGLPGIKALGLPLASRDMVQVSMNITDYELTPIHVVYSAVRDLAAEQGAEVEESELIGLLPRQALEAAAAGMLRLRNFEPRRVIESRIEEMLHEPDMAG